MSLTKEEEEEEEVYAVSCAKKLGYYVFFKILAKTKLLNVM